jgi:hypothetical protein
MICGTDEKPSAMTGLRYLRALASRPDDQRLASVVSRR